MNLQPPSALDATDEPPYRKWTVALTSSLMNCIQAGSFFMTPTTLMPLIVKDFHIPFSLSTAPIAFGKLSYVLLLLPGGLLVDTYGPRLSIILGLSLLSLLTFLYATLAQTYTQILILHALLAVAASISGVPVYSVVIAQWFQDGIGVAMGLVLAGYSLGGMLFPMVLGPVAAHFGWRVGMGVVSGVLGVVAVPIAWWGLKEKREVGDGGSGEDFAGVEVVNEELREEVGEMTPLISGFSLRKKQENVSHVGAFVGFACSYALLQYSFGTYAENMLFYLTADCELDLSVATLFLSSLNCAAFVAKLVGGHLGDRYNRMNVASVSCVVTALGIGFLFLPQRFGLFRIGIPSLTTSPIHIFVFTVIFGFGYGATFNSLYALVPIVFGRSHLGQIQSALFGIGLAGNALGSVLTGVFRSHYGSYDRAFLIGLLCCIANALIFNLTRHSFGESDLTMTPEEEVLIHREQALFEKQLAASGEPRSGVTTPSTTPTTPRMSPVDSYRSLPSPLRSPPIGFPPFESPPNFAARPMSSSSLTLPHSTSDFNLIPRITSSASFTRAQRPSGMSGAPLPVPRNWSNYSLPRMRTSSTQGELRETGDRGNEIENGGGSMRRTSTFENLVSSGVLSASMEFVGYLGQTAAWELSPRVGNGEDERRRHRRDSQDGEGSQETGNVGRM